MKDYQSRVREWAVACFGEEIANDKVERNHRFTEESLELVQSLGATKEEVLELVEYVFARPKGEPTQEVGGVMTTLHALAEANGLDVAQCGERALEEVWNKIDKIREKQKKKPKFSVAPQCLHKYRDGSTAWEQQGGFIHEIIQCRICGEVDIT